MPDLVQGKKKGPKLCEQGFYLSLNVLRPRAMSFRESVMPCPASVPFWLERWESHLADVI